MRRSIPLLSNDRGPASSRACKDPILSWRVNGAEMDAPVDPREAKAESALPADPSAVWPEGTLPTEKKREDKMRTELGGLLFMEWGDPPGSHQNQHIASPELSLKQKQRHTSF